MIAKRLAAAALALSLASSAAFAQTAQPATPAKPAVPAPAVVAPKAPAPAVTAPAPAAAPKAATPAAKKTNLNTANADELDKLPQIGPARAKSIVEARAKGKFKNWDDFTARNVVPKNAEEAIKDLVSF
jgi:DNA uptake protein ComE-like DNA-binding protein